PVCAFAIEEAACHRERGIDLKMFLGLFKNYRQTYIDRLTSGDEIGDRLNEHLESALGKIQESPSMSISTGWAHFDPEHHSCFEELLAEADADMYSSKRETGKAKTRS
ncbi:MAG: diguanylate cyclase, partial [bacterium]|nr:diguanylate cyclase [bacterium]